MDEPQSLFARLRRFLPLISVLLAAVAIYDGAIFYSRWREDRDAEIAQAREEAERAKKTLQLLGGNELKILNFYSSPGTIQPGGHANLCYGVQGAKQLRLEPPVDKVWPALSRCLAVSPSKDTEYKLTAEDGAGHSVTESFVLKVAR